MGIFKGGTTTTASSSGGVQRSSTATFVEKGGLEWVAGTVYDAGTVVSYNDLVYIADEDIAATNTTAPDVSSSWTASAGEQGPQGNYYVRLFQRAATQPDGPDSTWEPATDTTRGTYNGTDGWEVTVPDGTDQLWESEASFDPSAQTEIAADDWSSVFQAGAEGPAGVQGPAGPAGPASSARRYESSSEDETFT